MNALHIAAVVVLWVSLAVVLYTYLVYPLILLICFAVSQVKSDLRYLFGRVDRRINRFGQAELPGVTFIVPAHNEAQRLRAKLANLRAMDYPPEKLQVIIISDGSTDVTNDILRSVDDGFIESILLSERGGKARALNCAVARARHEVLVFSDASTLFRPDAVRKLVRHFANPRIGAACGALRFQASSESEQTEGVYWKYESALRLMESRLGAALNASGAVYALRRSAYEQLPSGAVLDDLLVPMNARKMGHFVVYDPEAVATDYAAETVRGEFARRVRIAAGSFQALPELLRMRLGSFTAFCFISHKLLRWLLPMFLIALILSNCVLVRSTPYAVLAIMQVAFYSWAALGLVCYDHLKRVRYALIGHFLLAMNVAFLVGFFRYLKNRNSIEWQRVS
jgi:cellulose synthase/poly-beta-1,6-N-acetylglucosamine synthase-like glycosyltransferase